jgi:TonB family protein
MTRYPILLFIFCYCSVAHAQSYYYDGMSKKSPKQRASRYAVFTKADSGYDAKVYNLNDVLLFTGHYITLSKDLQQDRQGEFASYYIKGTISNKGRYDNNLRTGLWKEYTYTTGALCGERHYNHDSLDGPCVEYHFVSGIKNVVGQYVNGRKEGTWTYYAKDGSMINETTYTGGKVTQVKRYDFDKEVVKVLSYKEGLLTGVRAYDSADKEVAYVAVKKDSSINGFAGKEEYDNESPPVVHERVHYPPDARDNGIEGTVIIKFTIDEDGIVTEVHVAQSISPELDAEALRVVKAIPRWKPRMLNGVPVPISSVVSITFRLE